MPLAPSFSFQVKKTKQTEVVLGGRKGGQVGRTRKKKKTKQKCNGRKDEKKRKYWFLISRNDSLKTVIKVKMRDRSGEKKNYTYIYKFHTMKVVDVVVVVVSLFQFFTFF